MIKTKSAFVVNILIKLFFIIFSVGFIIPLIYIISASFTNEDVLISQGFSIIPEKFDLTAYRYAFKNMEQMINSYSTTIFFSVVGTVLGLLVMSLMAYPLSKTNYKLRKPLTFYIAFTMLFSGGMIPSYILNTQYLHLGNTIWIYILPSLASAWHIVIIRTFFQGLPSELSDAAKIDGCSEWRTFFRIILPLSKPVLATVAVMTLVAKWNDWQTSLIYIRNPKLYSLQYLLQKMLQESEFLKNMIETAPSMVNNATPPAENLKFAMCIIAAGPMLVVFPYFQKYFSKGLTVGAVKG